MACVGAQGHSSAQSDFTATELSVSRWELMLSVRCQVELPRLRKEDSIVCESPGHCHTTSLAARRDGTGRLLKWSDSLLVEATARGNVVYFYSKATCIWEMLHGLYGYICHWWSCTVYRDPSEKRSHKNKGKAVNLQCLKTKPASFLIINSFPSNESYLLKFKWYRKLCKHKGESQRGKAKFSLKLEWIW